MNSPSVTMGIDISKQRLDLARFPQGDTFSVAYTDTGLAKMLTRVLGWSPQIISTRFVTGYGLANELLEARQGHILSQKVQRYARYGLLILDELGYVPFSKEEAELLFQVLAERHERGCGSSLLPTWALPTRLRSLASPL